MFSNTMDGKTIVEDQGLYRNSCGYCKSEGPTSYAYGLLAHSLSPYDYQELLDQSWRRSGMILYRPELEGSCCPAYTIRLKADCMEKSSEHARTMRRMQRYLDGLYSSPSSQREESDSAQEAADNDMKSQYETHNMDMDTELEKPQTFINKLNEGKRKLADRDSMADTLCTKIRHAIRECILHEELPDSFETSKIVVQRFQKGLPKRFRKLSTHEFTYTCSIAFSYAAALMRQNSECKILSSVYSQHKEANEVEGKTIHHQVASKLADTIAFRLQTLKDMHNFKVQACNGHLNFISAPFDSSSKIQLFTTSNSAIEPTDSKTKQSREGTAINQISKPFKSAVKHTLEIRMKNSVFDPEEYSLYRKYQIVIHHEKPEDVTELTFRRFLVDTPLTYVPLPLTTEGGTFLGFGSFHQQYLIDGRLVAVGVIDILPSCLSSNYFFWDPDFAFLSLGRYSALKEIEWVQEAKKYCQTLEYYYLGHYIHSCPKMHYKVTFRPSELLCPIRFQWVPYDLARPLLDKQPFVCLSDGLQAAQKLDWEEDSSSLIADNAVGADVRTEETDGKQVSAGAVSYVINEDDMNNVLLKFKDNYVRLRQLREWLTPPDESLDELISKLQNYIQLVGAGLAARMAYILL